MTITNGYVTRAELRKWLFGVADPATAPHPLDDLIDESVTAASRWVDRWCRRHFFQVVEPRTWTTCDPSRLETGSYGDMVAVTGVESDDAGDGVFVAWTSGDWELADVGAGPEPRPSRAVVAVARKFPVGRRVRVTGTWGWPEVPVSVRRAAMIQAARLVKRREAPEGVLGINQFGVLRVAGRPDPDVISLLGPYRLRTMA